MHVPAAAHCAACVLSARHGCALLSGLECLPPKHAGSAIRQLVETMFCVVGSEAHGDTLRPGGQEAVLEWRLARRLPDGAWLVQAVRRDGAADLDPLARPHPRCA